MTGMKKEKIMLQVENCDVVFHYNKANIADPTVPAWVLKVKGQTYYVKHVTSNARWSTKETPDNPSTKGSLKFKNVDVVIEDDCAEVVETK